LNVLKKCLTWQAALRIILKCTDERDFGKCVLDSVTGTAKECVLNCLESKEAAIEPKQEESHDCVKKVVDARKHFHSLNDREKRAFVEKITKKLHENHPNVTKEQVRRFMMLLFSSSNPTRVCERYEEIFGTPKN